MVIPPIEDNFDKSFKSEIPLIREAKIKGTAINFNELMKIVPNGLIQFRTKVLPHSKFRKSNPNKKWEDGLYEILHSMQQGQAKKTVENIIERLKILTSGHENCPVPENSEQLLIWWSMPPPDHSSSTS